MTSLLKYQRVINFTSFQDKGISLNALLKMMLPYSKDLC